MSEVVLANIISSTYELLNHRECHHSLLCCRRFWANAFEYYQAILTTFVTWLMRIFATSVNYCSRSEAIKMLQNCSLISNPCLQLLHKTCSPIIRTATSSRIAVTAICNYLCWLSHPCLLPTNSIACCTTPNSDITASCSGSPDSPSATRVSAKQADSTTRVS